MERGRPTIYFDTFTKEAEEKLLESYKDGGSNNDAIVILNIHRDTFYAWMKEEEKKNFSDFIKKCRAISQQWWEQKLKDNLIDPLKNINTTLFIFAVKNRFKEDYGDEKADVQITNYHYDVNVPKRLSEKEWKEGLDDKKTPKISTLINTA